MKDATQKIALIDWDDTIADWSDNVRAVGMVGCLNACIQNEEYSGIINGNAQTKEKVQKAISSLTDAEDPGKAYKAFKTSIRNHYDQMDEVKREEELNGVLPYSASAIFSYLFSSLPKDDKEKIIPYASEQYRIKSAEELPIHKGVEDFLSKLKDDGYQIAVASNKKQSEFDIETSEMIKSHPKLGEILEGALFATNEKGKRKPYTQLAKDALEHFTHNSDLPVSEILVAGDRLDTDSGFALNIKKAVSNREEWLPANINNATNVSFVLFDPKQKNKSSLYEGSEKTVSFNDLRKEGVEPLYTTSWEEAGRYSEAKKTAKKYLSESDPGHYLLRSQPRVWVEKKEDGSFITGKEAAPKETGALDVTFVDVEEKVKEGRDRLYKQNMFVQEGKVYQSSVTALLRDELGEEYALLIKDKRNWNNPIGRVDGDEFQKPENQTFVEAIEKSEKLSSLDKGRKASILGGLRELAEETGLNLSRAIGSGEITPTIFTSDDSSPFRREKNSETTVTANVVVDLGIQKDLRQFDSLVPQASENIEQARIFPLSSLKSEEKNGRNNYYLDIGGEKLPVFRAVGETLTKLQQEEYQSVTSSNLGTPPLDFPQKKRDRSPEIVYKKKDTKPAYWYVPEIEESEKERTEETPTIFSSKNYNDSSLSEDQIQSNYKLRGKSFDDWYLHSLSPERLALHQTIVEMSVSYRQNDEESFQKTSRDIYNEKVVHLIESHKDDFSAIKDSVTQDVDKQWEQLSTPQWQERIARNDSLKSKWGTKLRLPSPTMQSLKDASDKFDKNLRSYDQETKRLQKKINDFDNRETDSQEPTSEERSKLQDLTILTDELRVSRSELIKGYVKDQLLLKENSKKVRNLLVEGNGTTKGLLYDTEQMSEYGLEKNTLHSPAERKGRIVAGGAASGKGSITDQQKQKLMDDGGLVELNPDLYKPILLPFDQFSGDKKLHGSLTHQESSDVFDKILERWKEMARSGKAPHVLADVARADGWMKGNITTGNTKVEIHTPVLDTEKALERSYSRGEKTGRFVPTRSLIIGHKQQININKDTVNNGGNIHFYNNDVAFGQTPQIAFEYSGSGNIKSYDTDALYTYFKKDKLNPYGINSSSVDPSTPKDVVSSILSYLDDTRAVDIVEKDKTLASLNKKGLFISKEIDNSNIIENDNFQNIIKGAIQNNIPVQSESLKAKALAESISSDIEKQNAAKSGIVVPLYDLDEDNHIDMLRKLVETGVKYVSKTKNMYVYDFPKDPKTFEEQFPNGATIIKPNDKGETERAYTYNPNDDVDKNYRLTFDTRYFKSPEQCREAIDELQQTGTYTHSYATMNKHSLESKFITKKTVEDSIYGGQMSELQSLPYVVVGIKNDKGKNYQYMSEKKEKVQDARENGWIKISEGDLPALEEAINLYDSDPEKYKGHLMKVSKQFVYESGPGNIEGGFVYKTPYASRKKLLTELNTTTSTIYSKDDGKESMCIQSDSFVALSGDKAIEKGQWLILEKKSKNKLEQSLNSNNPNDYESLLNDLTILSDTSKNRNYRQLIGSDLRRDEDRQLQMAA